MKREFPLSLSQATGSSALWMQINNLSYQNKASVKINNGTWVSLNHQTVEMSAKERGYGGMAHGGLSTIRLTIPTSDFQKGNNVIQFRFDRSDAISMGFRVINIQILDGMGQKQLEPGFFAHEDPNTWMPPYADANSIAEGERLWRQAELWSHYLPNGRTGFWYNQSLPSRRPIRAKCADCHTQDGRDLELFSYSNHSIIERSKFHGLSEEEGKLIASYIRSLSATHEHIGRPGRPWNPPFQPGPSVADRPVWQWAAGAGLNAVLETDAEMLPGMFGSNPTKETVEAYFDSDKMWDTSTQKVSIQFPDWKRWLPLAHPSDAFSRDHWIDGDLTLHPIRDYETTRSYFANRQFPFGGYQRVLGAMNGLAKSYRRFFQQGSSSPRHWRTRDGDAITKGLQPGVPLELSKTSLARLLAVKLFELHHEFNLHDKAPKLISSSKLNLDQPRGRQWIGKQTQVFSISPHFTSCETNINCWSFLGQPEKVGIYETASWYQLQQVINPGNGMIGQTDPVDYNYMASFILLNSEKSGIPEPLRFYYSSNVMYQTRTWSGATNPNNGKGFRIRNMGPWMFYGLDDVGSHRGLGAGTMPRLLNDLKPGLGKWVVQAQLRQFLEEVNRPENHLDGWIRQGQPRAGSSTALEPVSITTAQMPNLSRDFRPAFKQYAQKIYWTLPKFVHLGVDCHLLQEVSNWSDRAWPLVDWNSLLGRCKQ